MRSKLVVIGGAALVETDDPQIVALEFFKGANEVDDAGDAQMLGGSGAGFHGDRTEWRGTALGEDDAVHAGAIGYAEQGAEVLRVFDAVEGEQQAGSVWAVARRLEEVFNGEKLLRANHGDYALMGGGLGQLRQLLAGFLANADAGLAADATRRSRRSSWRSRATSTWSKRRLPALRASSTGCTP